MHLAGGKLQIPVLGRPDERARRGPGRLLLPYRGGVQPRRECDYRRRRRRMRLTTRSASSIAFVLTSLAVGCDAAPVSSRGALHANEDAQGGGDIPEADDGSADVTDLDGARQTRLRPMAPQSIRRTPLRANRADPTAATLRQVSGPMRSSCCRTRSTTRPVGRRSSTLKLVGLSRTAARRP
jgi:hypothetical protein